MSQETDETQSKWKTRAYTTWTLVGICILVGVVLYVCNIVWQAVTTVIITALAVFLLHGVVNWLQAHKMPRVLAVTITFVVVSALVVGCILSFIPSLITQLASFVSSLPNYSSQIQDFISRHSHTLGSNGDEALSGIVTSANDWIRNQASNIISAAANGVVGGIVGIGNAAVIGFIALVCSFWILLDLPVISREIRGLFPDERQKDIDIFAKAFGNAVYGWAKSTFVCAIITGMASGLCFWACGIPYSSMLGFICGILYLVPYIGPMISCVIVTIIALFVSPLICVVSIVICVIINNVVGNIISPKLMESSVSVHPAIILIAILVGGALGGVAGMLLSIPIIAAVQGLFVAYYEANTGKVLSTPGGALFPEKKKSGSKRRAKKRAARQAAGNAAPEDRADAAEATQPLDDNEDASTNQH